MALQSPPAIHIWLMLDERVKSDVRLSDQKPNSNVLWPKSIPLSLARFLLRLLRRPALTLAPISSRSGALRSRPWIWKKRPAEGGTQSDAMAKLYAQTAPPMDMNKNTEWFLYPGVWTIYVLILLLSWLLVFSVFGCTPGMAWTLVNLFHFAVGRLASKFSSFLPSFHLILVGCLFPLFLLFCFSFSF